MITARLELDYLGLRSWAISSHLAAIPLAGLKRNSIGRDGERLSQIWQGSVLRLTLARAIGS
jgi:hypothetical protein